MESGGLIAGGMEDVEDVDRAARLAIVSEALAGGKAAEVSAEVGGGLAYRENAPRGA
jgi:hypothetical protein